MVVDVAVLALVQSQILGAVSPGLLGPISFSDKLIALTDGITWMSAKIARC